MTRRRPGQSKGGSPEQGTGLTVTLNESLAPLASPLTRAAKCQEKELEEGEEGGGRGAPPDAARD